MQLISFAKKWLPGAYTFVLFVLTSYPQKYLPKNDINDKTAHFVAFAVLVILWLWKKPDFLKVSLICILYGVFIEIVQSLLPAQFNRHFEFLDIAADAIGVLIGLSIYIIVTRISSN